MPKIRAIRVGVVSSDFVAVDGASSTLDATSTSSAMEIIRYKRSADLL
ncbi:unnamed protein product [Acidithrix sp. C25]|nr:unnamed protein product [Acidithrix sp. C25]